MNLIEKLGLEKCKAIVGEAPNGTTNANTDSYFKENDYGVWSVWAGYWESAFRWPEGEMYLLDNLRTAIAKFECDHDWEDITCNGDLERQLICTYCSMKKSVPFELNAKQWTDEDTDHYAAIRNHISPLTGVIER